MAAFSFPILFKFTALVGLIAFSLLAVSDGCTSKSDCEVNEVCCSYGGCVYGSCVGHYCSSDSDCSSGESCCSHKCVYGSSCVGQYCSSYSDCSSGESCCSSECRYGSDCLGSSCSFNSDCGNWESCCNGICQHSYDDCYDSGAVIAGAVIGSLVFLCMISMCIFYARRRQGTIRYGRLIVRQRATATTVTTTGAIQSNPPHPGQVPPPVGYQQSYPHYPPPQYEQQQHTANPPPPYNPGTSTANEQPPPYTAAPQQVSGGVHAPKPSYGAVQSGPTINININDQ